jgi:single-strand DNA-binding protein
MIEQGYAYLNSRSGSCGKNVRRENIKVAKFSIATPESSKDENRKLNTSTEWHSIILWRG